VSLFRAAAKHVAHRAAFLRFFLAAAPSASMSAASHRTRAWN
jgi:hypothetical protein